MNEFTECLRFKFYIQEFCLYLFENTIFSLMLSDDWWWEEWRHESEKERRRLITLQGQVFYPPMRVSTAGVRVFECDVVLWWWHWFGLCCLWESDVINLCAKNEMWVFGGDRCEVGVSNLMYPSVVIVTLLCCCVRKCNILYVWDTEGTLSVVKCEEGLCVRESAKLRSDAWNTGQIFFWMYKSRLFLLDVMKADCFFFEWLTDWWHEWSKRLSVRN